MKPQDVNLYSWIHHDIKKKEMKMTKPKEDIEVLQEKGI